SSSTKSIKLLNNFIAKDERVDHCLISIYDGMTLCIKK
ncbi:MAG: SAM-dependent methyltransferase, partial [Gammaproteobacteria bacterium]|nr:SAM-dependent methyltransferase [Gammaproteobacteria bacterium]